MSLRLDSRIVLNNGVKMPVLGLGTAGAEGKRCVAAVREALRIGYRLIDTASAYGNEKDVGTAVRGSGISREDLFVTSKVRNGDQGYESTLRACGESLRRLRMDYLDLYLIHWPVPGKRLQTWRAMVELLESGKARAIGVSNFMADHLEGLARESAIVPAVNQIELSPFLRQGEAVAYCRRHGVQVEAYSPLTRGRRLKDPTIGALAEKLGRSPAQVLIRWSLQNAFVAIPKSVVADRIRENADVFNFELPAEAVKTLDGLDQDLHFDWDPTDVP